MLGEDAARQPPEVEGKALQDAGGPAFALLPGLGKGQRLLVVDHCRGHPLDPLPAQDALGGEFDVLSHCDGMPAAHFPDQLQRDHKTAAVDHRRKVCRAAGVVIHAVDHPVIDGVAARNCGIVGVLAVTVSLRRPRSRTAGVVHRPQESRVHEVIRVENTGGVEAPLFQKRIENLCQHFPLRPDRKAAVEDSGARPAGSSPGIVGAVVRRYNDLIKLVRIILLPKAFDELSNHAFLIACRNHQRETGLRLAAPLRPAAPKRKDGIHRVVEKIKGKDKTHQPCAGHQNRNRCHDVHSPVLSSL